jgi:allophanate hydrolase subunit 2
MEYGGQSGRRLEKDDRMEMISEKMYSSQVEENEVADEGEVRLTAKVMHLRQNQAVSPRPRASEASEQVRASESK